MSDEEGNGPAFFAGVIFGAVAVALLFMAFSSPSWVVKDMKAKAVELKAAEWKVDPKTGKTEFTWKEPKE